MAQAQPQAKSNKWRIIPASYWGKTSDNSPVAQTAVEVIDHAGYPGAGTMPGYTIQRESNYGIQGDLPHYGYRANHQITGLTPDPYAPMYNKLPPATTYNIRVLTSNRNAAITQSVIQTNTTNIKPASVSSLFKGAGNGCQYK
jgi:hypothetical protein